MKMRCSVCRYRITEGQKDFFDWLYEQLPPSENELENGEKPSDEAFESLSEKVDEEQEEEKPKVDPNHIKVAIIGKPNVGKKLYLKCPDRGRKKRGITSGWNNHRPS